MISNDTKTLLAYSFLKGIGRKFLTEISIAKENNSSEPLSHIEKRFSETELNDAYLKAEDQISIAHSFGHNIISRLDESYPDSLRDTIDAPAILFCNGNINLLKSQSISIIGTREPTSDGLKIAARITSWFSRNGWTITSGLANGVDTIAHQYCLKSNGYTIAILAHGLEKVYPASNKELAKDIVKKNGLIISEYRYNSFVAKSNFVERDRIQAGLSKAVFLVQSDIKGGSLHASRAALNYNRLLIVVGQSDRDKENNEPKIQANLALLSLNKKIQTDLLKVSSQQTNNIIPLMSKDNYESVNNKIKGVIFNRCNMTRNNKLL
ncbi:DNA-processing protein DprA [Shewanella baltica]|uniref:DNA-processing protein DprA n=1 Tax=Shewanella baltica TaxID=62322 RepID=UPI00217D5455|nr:DNA-processing protein DprA [Shewanella baltica]MCS6233602.1 DNA-processing protein DprA [Shewanella baltica]MCS6268186.1 DNA-processing protein DprA [Shewanella baltica]